MFGNKQFFLIIDTEATIEGTVADFGAIICCKQGKIYSECAVLVTGEFAAKPLSCDKDANGIWELADEKKRHASYKKMLEDGTRMSVSVPEINRWLTRIYAKYKPELTAFNLAHELDKLKKTGIDVNEFVERFCLRDAVEAHFAQSKKYKVFIQNKSLGIPVQESSLHTMASFVSGVVLPPQQHTALEDAKIYALPVLTAIVKRSKWREKIVGYV